MPDLNILQFSKTESRNLLSYKQKVAGVKQFIKELFGTSHNYYVQKYHIKLSAFQTLQGIPVPPVMTHQVSFEVYSKCHFQKVQIQGLFQ